MIEGLWTGEFRSNVSNITVGIGVIVFRKGKIYGGGAINYFTGSYTVEGDKLAGELKSTHFAGDPITIFGLIEAYQSSVFKISGEVKEDRIDLEGTSTEIPTLKFFGVLTRRTGDEIFEGQ